MSIYCKWCGNNSVNDDAVPCEVCSALITNHLEAALDAFTLLADSHGICCRGLVTKYSHLERNASMNNEVELAESIVTDLKNTKVFEHVDASHLFIHPKDGENHNDTTTVECGVNLYPGYARCYWIFDSDRAGCSEGREYGPEISYQLGAERFLEIVCAVLDQAANAASACGVVSCEHCGDHHHEDCPCDCQDNKTNEELEEDVMNPYGDDPLNTNI